METAEATLRRLWRPRAILRVAIPLLLVFILAWVDKQWVVRKGSDLHGWRDPAHYGLVVVGTLIGHGVGDHLMDETTSNCCRMLTAAD